jgi:hypothetical protein
MSILTPRALAAPTIAVLAGSALALGTASGQQGRTLTFTGPDPKPRDVKMIDVKPKGLSNLDRYVVATSVRSGGHVVGRVHGECVILDRSYRGQDCHFVLVLRDGTITADGGGLDRAIPGAPRDPDPFADEYAVTGGTGAYAGASGEMVTRKETMTVRLSG